MSRVDSETANAERLKNLLCYPYLFGPIAAGTWSERDPNSVSDSL